MGLQAQRDRLRVFAQESEDVLKASQEKEEQALQQVAALETKFGQTMDRLFDAYERDQATIRAMETSAVCLVTQTVCQSALCYVLCCCCCCCCCC